MRKNFIDNIQIENPCSESWDKMRGNDQTRFCSHCAKSVSNLSEMTRKEAMKTVREADGNLCVRYIQNPINNAPLFADKLYQIGRRTGLAAGVLGASLTLSTLTYAQGGVSISNELIANPDVAAATQCDDKKDKTDGVTGSISGTITDANGAVIPNVMVSLTNVETSENLVTTANEVGIYSFKDMPAGVYNLSILDLAFQSKTVENINLIAGAEQIVNLATEPIDREIFVMGTMVAINYASELHRAVANNQLEDIKNLIANGANVNQKDENYGNITPLFLAVENGNFEIASMLLESGAKVNARNAQRQTPLMRLDADATAEFARLLIGYGARINATDTEGNTTLITTAGTVSGEVLQILINEGANINAQNKTGQTALMNAAESDNLAAVRALINAGANVNLKNEDGETALDLASDAEIENLLIQYGAVEADN